MRNPASWNCLLKAEVDNLLYVDITTDDDIWC
jgi:hypothetical protein